MSFERARAVADAVLYEGYALYPYRPTSTKNQLRWQFGVLAPRSVSEATRADPWWLELECLVRGGAETRLDGQLRFLRLCRRTIEAPDGTPLSSFEIDGRLLVPWDEGELCELPLRHELTEGPVRIKIGLDGSEAAEELEGARVRRVRAPLTLEITAGVEWVESDLFKLRVRVENLGGCPPSERRDDTLPWATLGTHLLFSVEDGEFVSLLDPPADAARAASSCRSVGTHPVLAGEPGRCDLLLAAPIILYDHPAVAPESPGDLFDATEIDEILSLRTLTLTDEEKRLARATDPRVAALLDRVESLPGAAWARLHGAFRDPALRIGDAAIAPGSRVRLKPGPRRTDAQDLFLDGRVATVHEIKRSVDGRDCLAVTIDGDPAAELHAWHGRYHYFYADEVEPLT